MTNVEIVRLCEPWYPSFVRVFRIAMRDVLACVDVLGIPRPVERANWFHGAVRNNFRSLCDHMEPFLRLVEEREGKGLDYVVLDIADTPIAIRWGKWGGTRISRNSTFRQTDIQEQGRFPWDMESDPEMATATIGYTVEDDFTEAGRPCWRMGRLALLRERRNDCEFVHNIAIFEKPDEPTHELGPANPRVIAREVEVNQMLHVADELRRRIG